MKLTIKNLRATWPGNWRYNRTDNTYEHENGWHVYKCSSPSPRFDGDDDNFVTQYRRSDTGQLVLLDLGLKKCWCV
jgi:hypothetical protein